MVRDWKAKSICAWSDALKEGLDYSEIIEKYPPLFKHWPNAKEELALSGLVQYPTYLPRCKALDDIVKLHSVELGNLKELKTALNDLYVIQTTFHNAAVKGYISDILTVGAWVNKAWLYKTQLVKKNGSDLLQRPVFLSRKTISEDNVLSDINPEDIVFTQTIQKFAHLLKGGDSDKQKGSYRFIHESLKFNIIYNATLTSVKHGVSVILQKIEKEEASKLEL